MPEPRFELLVSPADTRQGERYGQGGSTRYSRLKLFAVLFLGVAAAGLTYTFARPAVYRSTATLLLVPPSGPAAAAAVPASGQTAVRPAAAVSDPGAAAGGSPAVQSQLLAGQSILSALFDRLKAADPPTGAFPASVGDLRDMLKVVPLNGTNMVQLQAHGSDRHLLPVMVNDWIDVYLAAYKRAQRQDSSATATGLQEQLTALQKRIAAKRTQLDAFRQQYDIVSIKRDENRALARLKGLNNSLDKANSDLAEAKAHRAALRAALARGEPMVRQQDQRGLDALEQRAADLQGELSDYRQRYTDQYMALDQDAIALKKRLHLVQTQLRARRKASQEAALSEARQAVASARQVVSQLEQQLQHYKQTASDFSARLAQYKTMSDELDQLEGMRHSVQDRVVQLQVGRADLLPAVRVLERASYPTEPISPAYRRDAGLSLAMALAVALLGVWLWEFLARPARPVPERPGPTVYTLSPLGAPADDPAARLQDHGAQPVLDAPAARELGLAEVRALLQASDLRTRALIGSLLSGLSATEVAGLRWSDLDGEHARVDLPGERRVAMTGPLQALWDSHREDDGGVPERAPVWSDSLGRGLAAADLDDVVRQAAARAGLARAEEVDAQVLRHTYLAFLARQGLGLAGLVQRMGPLSDQELRRYRTLAPPEAGLRLDDVNSLYPAFRDAG